MMGSHSYKGDHHHHHDVHEPNNYSPTTTRLSLLISRPSTPPEAPPPLPPTVSVPFKWEEAPGKPRQCHTQSEPKDNNSATRTLELPPRLLFLEANNKASNNMNMDAPSPTTVLAGPYVGRAMSFTTSYRTPRDNWVSNFGSARWSSFRKIGEDDAEGSFGFSGRSSHGTLKKPKPKPKPEVKITRAPGTRRASSLSLSHQSMGSSHLWASIYESFKHMVPWRRRQEKQRKRAQFDTA